MKRVVLLVMLFAAPASGQSRVYTNADLGRPIERATTVTTDELAWLAAHQFALPSPYPGPQVVIIGGHPEDGPFGPFKDLPPTAPLSNDPYYFGPVLYGPRVSRGFMPSRQQPMRRDGVRRGR
jgi:hypothetical protein